MANSMARRGVLAAGLLAVLVLAAIVALPYVASTRIVRDRIATEMGRWSGYRVTIDAPAKIHVWPGLSAVLDGVTFSDWNDGKAVATVERIEIDLSALAALRGDAVFSSARLVRPSWRLEANAPGGFLPQFAGKGRILSAIDRTRAMIDAHKTERPALAADEPFGTVTFTDGRIVRPGTEDLPPIVEDIDGTINWPKLNQSGSIVATAMWNGEAVAVDLRSEAPLLLLAGGDAPLRVTLRAKPAEVEFNGSARIVGNAMLDGAIRVDAPSFDRLAVWAGADVPGWERLTSVSLSGTIVGAADHMKLDQATIKLDGSTGTGAIEIDATPERLAVSGSLAFDTMSLDTILEAFLPLTTAERDARPATGTTTLPPLQADLRLSASTATAAGFDLAEVATAIQIKETFAAFDLLDASVLGGSAEVGLRVDRGKDGVTTALRVAATDIDGAALIKTTGATVLAPTGRGTFSLDLKGSGHGVIDALAEGDGAAKASFGPGALSRFDLPAFLDRCKSGGFFPLAETSAGSLDVDGVEVSATISDGLAHLYHAEAKFAGGTLWAAGVLSYADGGLALSGGLAEPGETSGDPATEETSFFVGGSLSAPFISPIPPPAAEE
ncbi:MAG: AsmA family protein [Rhizobiaceae bacterium]|nr:AsmA family protein [Rhizobiaceae bacterium]